MSLSTEEILIIIETGTFIISSFVVVRQLVAYQRQNKFLFITQMWSEIQKLDLLVIERPPLGTVISGEIPGATDDDIRKNVMVYLLLNFGEMLYWLRRHRFLDDEQWEPWRKSMDRWLEQPWVRSFTVGHILPDRMYTDSFRHYLEERVAETEGRLPPDDKHMTRQP